MTTEFRLAGTLTLRANLISYAPLRKYVKYDVAASFKKILITKISFCVVLGEISLSIWGKTEREGEGKTKNKFWNRKYQIEKFGKKYSVLFIYIFCFQFFKKYILRFFAVNIHLPLLFGEERYVRSRQCLIKNEFFSASWNTDKETKNVSLRDLHFCKKAHT